MIDPSILKTEPPPCHRSRLSWLLSSILARPPNAADSRESGFVHWPIAAVRKVLAATREGIEFATRYQMLANMTDEKLAALGVRRKDLARIAVNGWRR